MAQGRGVVQTENVDSLKHAPILGGVNDTNGATSSVSHAPHFAFEEQKSERSIWTLSTRLRSRDDNLRRSVFVTKIFLVIMMTTKAY